jgi:hypothetical protein
MMKSHPLSFMKRSQLKIQTPHAGDLSFPPPFSEQSKYLALANKFLCTNGTPNNNIAQVDSSGYFQKTKKKKAS